MGAMKGNCFVRCKPFYYILAMSSASFATGFMYVLNGFLIARWAAVMPECCEGGFAIGI
jgi:hypothetical protein